jgi:hypothetical protein
MDGRVQDPVNHYLKTRFNVDYVDVVTEAGPNRIIGAECSYSLVQSIFERVKISVQRHGSIGIAIAGHHDCAGNPADKQEQVKQIEMAVQNIAKRFNHINIIGLWIDENWQVSEVASFAP